MANINNGFKLLRVSDDNSPTSRFICENGEVSYTPVTKYRLEKKNAFNPASITRREPYHEDAFDITAVLSPAEYTALLAVLNASGKLYIEYMAGALVQYPVDVDSFPKRPDDLRSYADKISFRLVSRYSGRPTYVYFEAFSSTDEDEMIN